MLKIVNNRDKGSLFHYAHFLCDCLFTEVVNEIYNYDEVYREKTLNQTIGNFDKIYTDVMRIKTTELTTQEYDNLDVETIILKNKENYCNEIYFDKFRNYIFTRYNINPLVFDNDYPQVILIKRGARLNLIDDETLKKVNTNITSGSERREINQIDLVETYLKNKYGHQCRSIYLENISFEEQIKYFNNAKMIICAHGAGMSNMFFCKPGTQIIEVICNKHWPFFDVISNILKLNHIKQVTNELNEIINCIEQNAIL